MKNTFFLTLLIWVCIISGCTDYEKVPERLLLKDEESRYLRLMARPDSYTYQRSFEKTPYGGEVIIRRFKHPEATASVFVIHGKGEHSARYNFLISFLSNLKLNMNLISLRGHGQSKGIRGHINELEDYLDDIDVMIEKSGDKDLKKIIIGHSMGAFVAMRYIQEKPGVIDQAILLSPFFGIYEKPSWLLDKFAQIVSLLHPTFPILPKLSSNDTTKDERILKLKTEDFFTSSQVTIRFYTEISEHQALSFVKAPEVKIPILYLQAAEEFFVNKDEATRLFNELGSKDKKRIEFKGYYHELLNEVGREKVANVILDWIKDRIDYIETVEDYKNKVLLDIPFTIYNQKDYELNQLDSQAQLQP